MTPLQQFAAVMNKLDGIERRLRRVELQAASFLGAIGLAAFAIETGHIVFR